MVFRVLIAFHFDHICSANTAPSRHVIVVGVFLEMVKLPLPSEMCLRATECFILKQVFYLDWRKLCKKRRPLF